MVVLPKTKIQIWKQFTTKYIHNEISLQVVLPKTKIQIWKQFTTVVRVSEWATMLCYLKQRYKFESNSQLLLAVKLHMTVVLPKTKIQIWKQFTTTIGQVFHPIALCYLKQRYKFESNSQPRADKKNGGRCCVT